MLYIGFPETRVLMSKKDILWKRCRWRADLKSANTGFQAWLEAEKMKACVELLFVEVFGVDFFWGDVPWTWSTSNEWVIILALAGMHVTSMVSAWPKVYSSNLQRKKLALVAEKVVSFINCWVPQRHYAEWASQNRCIIVAWKAIKVLFPKRSVWACLSMVHLHIFKLPSVCNRTKWIPWGDVLGSPQAFGHSKKGLCYSVFCVDSNKPMVTQTGQQMRWSCFSKIFQPAQHSLLPYNQGDMENPAEIVAENLMREFVSSLLGLSVRSLNSGFSLPEKYKTTWQLTLALNKKLM